MKISGYFCCFLVSLVLLSCAKREKWETYRDPVYPIVIDYSQKYHEMQISSNLVDEKDRIVKRLQMKPGYRLEVMAHFPESDPDETEIPRGLYKIRTFKYEKDFRKEFEGEYKRWPVVRETVLNGTPAILMNDSAKHYETYVLLVPGVYAEIDLGGLIYSEEVTREALKHFRWTQPIDTSTPEFQSWKKHILEILKGNTVEK